jgi:hypothetical protein
MHAAVAINGKERPLFFASTKVVAAIDAYLEERVRRGQGATTETQYRRLDPCSRLFLTGDGHDMPIAVRAIGHGRQYRVRNHPGHLSQDLRKGRTQGCVGTLRTANDCSETYRERLRCGSGRGGARTHRTKLRPQSDSERTLIFETSESGRPRAPVGTACVLRICEPRSVHRAGNHGGTTIHLQRCDVRDERSGAAACARLCLRDTGAAAMHLRARWHRNVCRQASELRQRVVNMVLGDGARKIGPDIT